MDVWPSIIEDHGIGPFFRNQNLNGSNYLAVLQIQIIPLLDLLNQRTVSISAVPRYTAGPATYVGLER